MAILVDNFSGTPFEGRGETVFADYAGRTDGQPVYVGWAEPNSLSSQPVWKICFITYDAFPVGNFLTRRFAIDPVQNKALFTQIWDDRATLNYV